MTDMREVTDQDSPPIVVVGGNVSPTHSPTFSVS